jgi:FkbM family methyltransferase
MLKLSTNSKVAAARLLSKAVCLLRRILGKSSAGIFKRGGLRYNLDLSEGIDLAIFLFGTFEKEVVEYCRTVLREGDHVVDVGANMGAHSLNMARIVGPNGRVVACEPTNYAFAKLARNISLNQGIADRVMASQVFLAANAAEMLPAAVASSWPLDASDGEKHELSQGVLKPTTGAVVMTLDAFVAAQGAGPIRLLKMDVDGHELTVLKGADGVLKQHPAIILELAPCTASDGEDTLRQILRLLHDFGYQTVTCRRKNFRITDECSIFERIPYQGSINVLIR